MLLHALHHFPADPAADFSWWLVHVETLTPVQVHSSGRKITVQITRPAETATPFRSHPEIPFDAKAIGKDIFREFKAALGPACTFKTYHVRPAADAQAPEYLLVFDINGENPAIFRTQDPAAIFPIDTAANTLGPALAWSTATDISAEGWAYFWEDCMRAYEHLSEKFIAEN